MRRGYFPESGHPSPLRRAFVHKNVDSIRRGDYNKRGCLSFIRQLGGSDTSTRSTLLCGWRKHNMDLFSIQCFLSAAKHLNFSLAAKEMFISQPAMSQRMSAIEKDFGVKLFERTSHNVKLTPAGELAARELPSLLKQYDKIRQDARNGSRCDDNRLSISYNGPTEWANVHKLIQKFHQKHPKIQLTVQIGLWGQMVNELRSGNVDMIFTEQAEIKGVAGVESVYLFRDYTALAVPTNSPLARYDKIDPALLRSMGFVLADRDLVIEGQKISAKSMKRIYERLNAAGLDVTAAQLVDNYDVAIAMASCNIAIAPIPRSFKIKGHNSVHYVDIDSDKAYLDFCLAWSGANEKSALRLFSDFCRQYYAQPTGQAE